MFVTLSQHLMIMANNDFVFILRYKIKPYCQIFVLHAFLCRMYLRWSVACRLVINRISVNEGK